MIGPYSHIDPPIKLSVWLKKNKALSLVSDDREELPVYGVYRNRGRLLFEVTFSVDFDAMMLKVRTYGLDAMVAAVERSLNSYVDEEGKGYFGDIIIMKVVQDNSQNADPHNRFLTLEATTDKGDIKNFLGVTVERIVVF